MPIYPRKWETGWGLVPYLKRNACWGHSNMPSCFLFPFLFEQLYDGSKGFEVCCPHFQQKMQLYEQSMELKLSEQKDMRQWYLHHSYTIEASVQPHKYYAHFWRGTQKYTKWDHPHTHMHTKAIVSHSAQLVESIKTRHNGLQHNIRVERCYNQLLYASTDPSFTSKSKQKDLVASTSLVLSI